MEKNKALINDTANFYLYDKDGNKIVSLKETQEVSVEKEHGKTYIYVRNALFDTDMLSVIGESTQVKKATDFEKDSGINLEKKSIKIKSDIDEDMIFHSSASYKVLLQSITYDPDTMEIKNQIDMAFPKVKYMHNSNMKFVHGEALTPEYKFEVIGEYDMSFTDVPKGYKIK